MITLVTGPINSGKTTWMLEHYRKQPEGDGFVAPKWIENGEFSGYLCQKLSTGVQMPYLMKSFYSADKPIRDTIGPFSMLESAISYMEEQYDDWLAMRISPLYMDDIGPLELSGKGLDTILQKLLASGIDLVLSVRTECFLDVLERYRLDQINLITIT